MASMMTTSSAGPSRNVGFAVRTRSAGIRPIAPLRAVGGVRRRRRIRRPGYRSSSRMGLDKKRSIMDRFRRLVLAFLKAKKKGNRTRAKMLARRIMAMVRNHRALAKTQTFERFRMAASPYVKETEFSQFEPSFDESPEFTPEGEIEDAPEDFEDEEDMDGFGFFQMGGQRSMLDNLYLAGLIGGAAVAITGKTKKNKRLGTQVAGASLALMFFKNMMDRRSASEAGMAGYGELEIMSGYGDMAYDIV